MAIAETIVEVSENGGEQPLPEVNPAAVEQFVQRYLDFFPEQHFKGMHLGVYEHSSVARDVIRSIMEGLGASVTSLGRTEEFVPIDTEAVAEVDIRRGLEWAATHYFDAIISTDGDGDRPLISDETGAWLRGDIVGLICARYLGARKVVVPVSCNTAIELCGSFETIVRTRIGSPYVIAGMQQISSGNDDNGEIVHLRPSGNAPELRCYCEASTQERAMQLVQAVLARIRN